MERRMQCVLLGSGRSPAALQVGMVGPSVPAVPIVCPRPGARWTDMEACSKLSGSQRLPFAWRFPVSFNPSAQVLEWLLLLALLAAGRLGGGVSRQHHGWRCLWLQL